MATVTEVKQQVERLRRMNDLSPTDFAEEGGLADSLAREFGDKLKPTQLRKVFTEIKRIRREVEHKMPPEAVFEQTKLMRLMPTLAYAVGRELLPRDFYDILKLSFGRQRVQTNADFLRAADFVEAIVAYHKYRSKVKEG